MIIVIGSHAQYECKNLRKKSYQHLRKKSVKSASNRYAWMPLKNSYSKPKMKVASRSTSSFSRITGNEKWSLLVIWHFLVAKCFFFLFFCSLSLVTCPPPMLSHNTSYQCLNSLINMSSLSQTGSCHCNNCLVPLATCHFSLASYLQFKIKIWETALTVTQNRLNWVIPINISWELTLQCRCMAP